MTHGHPPQLSPERLDQMVAYATSFSQEPRKSNVIQFIRHYPKRLAFGLTSAAIAASVIFAVSVTPPQKAPTVKSRDDVADLMMYDLLEDLS